MRRIAFVPLFFAAALSAQTYGRLDFHLQTAQGQAVSGATVHVYQQPSAITTVNVSTVQVLAVTTSSFPSQTIYYTLVTFTSTVPPISSGQTYAFSGLTGYTALNGKTLNSLTSSTIFTMAPIYPASNQALFQFGTATYASTADTGTGQVVNTSACGSPANISVAGQAALYSTANGGPLAQPVVTTGFGEAFAYAVQGCYTVVYSSPYTGTLTYKDQNAIPAAAIVSSGGSSGAKGGQQAIQFNNSGSLAGSAATVDSAGDLFTPTMLNVGTLAGAAMSITPLGTPTNWTLDSTSPNTAFSSLVQGTTSATFPGTLAAVGIQDTGAATVNAALKSGGDPGAKISNAFAQICVGSNCSTSGAGIVDACQLSFQGVITVTSDPFASIRTATSNANFTLRLCGAHIAVTNALLPLVIPGGVVVEGNATHPLVGPNYPNPEGTTIQPATSGYKGVVVSMGSASDNNNPMGVQLKNLAISCLASGEAYATSTFTISSWATVGGSLPTTATFQTSAQTLAPGDFVSLSGFGTTTAFNGIIGRHLIVVTATSTQFTALINLAASSATEAGVGNTSPTTTGILNANAQEDSKIENVNISGCQRGYDNEIDPTNGVGGKAHSGFNSIGLVNSNITVPRDFNGIAVMVGVTSPSQMASPGNITGPMTIQGSNSGGGPAMGTALWIDNTSRFSASDIHADYVDTVVEAGEYASTNTLFFKNVVGGSANSTYPWVNGYRLGPKIGYGVNIVGGSMLGIADAAAITLYDATYPSAACSLLASSESSIGFYSKGFGGGVNQVISSTARTACLGSINPLVALTNANLTFTGTTNYLNGIWHHGATGSTVGTNYASYSDAFDVYCGSCGSPATYAESDFLNIAAGATPALTRFFDPPASPPASTVFQVGGSTRSWTEFRVGNGTNNTIFRQFGAFNLYNPAGTFFANFAFAGTATRTNNVPDGPAGLVLTGGFTSTAAASDAFTLQGVTASSHCFAFPTNASAATNVATTYVSAVAANTVTLTHTATASMTWNIGCTGN